MNDVYQEKAILELIGWLVPTVLVALAAIWAKWRKQIRQHFAKRRQQRAAKREDGLLLQNMAREWPSFSGDMTLKVTSLQDNYSRVTRKIHAIRDDLSRQIGGVTKVVGTLLAMTIADFDTSPEPRFICDENGRITHVNVALATELGLDKDDLLEWRWRGRVPPELLGSFMERFKAANVGHYQMDDELHFRHRDRSLIRFRALLMPFPPDEGPATHWAAKLTRLDPQP